LQVERGFDDAGVVAREVGYRHRAGIDSRAPVAKLGQSGAQTANRFALHRLQLREIAGQTGQGGVRRAALPGKLFNEVEPVGRGDPRRIAAFFLQFVDYVGDEVDFDGGDAGLTRICDQAIEVAQIQKGQRPAKRDEGAENDDHEKTEFHDGATPNRDMSAFALTGIP
jgi:hypothetical protein